MTKRPIPTSGFAFRGKVETGCGMMPIAIGGVVIAVAVMLTVLFLMRTFG